MAMTSEDIVKDCVALIREAKAPLSINEIRKGLPKESRFPEQQKAAIVSALRQLPKTEGVTSWPNFGGQKALFWRQSFPHAIREGLPKVLDDAPMTVALIARALKRIVAKASENRLREEARAQLRILVSDSAVVRIGNYYCGLSYLGRVLPSKGHDNGLLKFVITAVEELESARGNYVSISDLRNSATFRSVLDQAILSASRDRDLVLARYDGPTPQPGERDDLLDAGNGVFFVGVARARETGVS
jgi:hypothetical protein